MESRFWLFRLEQSEEEVLHTNKTHPLYKWLPGGWSMRIRQLASLIFPLKINSTLRHPLWLTNNNDWWRMFEIINRLLLDLPGFGFPFHSFSFRVFWSTNGFGLWEDQKIPPGLGQSNNKVSFSDRDQSKILKDFATFSWHIHFWYSQGEWTLPIICQRDSKRKNSMNMLNFWIIQYSIDARTSKARKSILQILSMHNSLPLRPLSHAIQWPSLKVVKETYFQQV